MKTETRSMSVEPAWIRIEREFGDEVVVLQVHPQSGPYLQVKCDKDKWNDILAGGEVWVRAAMIQR